MGKMKELIADTSYAGLTKDVDQLVQTMYYTYHDLGDLGTPIELSGDSMVRVQLELSLAQLMFEADRLLKAVKSCRPDGGKKA